MFISKARHLEAIAYLREGYEARLLQMQSQIEDLRKLIFVPNTANVIPLVHQEADAVLSVSDSNIPINEADTEIQRELDLIVSGEYEYARELS